MFFLPSSARLPTHVARRLCSTFFTMETSWSRLSDLRVPLVAALPAAGSGGLREPCRCRELGSDRIPAKTAQEEAIIDLDRDNATRTKTDQTLHPNVVTFL